MGIGQNQGYKGILLTKQTLHGLRRIILFLPEIKTHHVL